MPLSHSICGCNARPGQVVTTNASPLQLDPTRTVTLRGKLIARVRASFLHLRQDVVEFLVTQDALGLKQRSATPNFDRLINQAQEREFAFLTDAKKLEAFNQWFAAQVARRVIFPEAGTRQDQPWTTEYVESAYRRGLLNAYLASQSEGVLKTAVIGTLTQAQFLHSAFGAPEARSKVQLLGTRALESLKGVTATMASEMNRILAQGMIDGKGPATIAREMNRKVEQLTRSRAFTIARTEIIHAHAEGQIDGFEKLGVAELGVRAEWSTAGDERVCVLCAVNEGKTFTLAQARGKIPLHPNCRCSWIPAIPSSRRKIIL